MNWSEIIVGAIVGAIFGSILQSIVTAYSRFRRSRKGEWHGKWYEVLPPFQGLPERWDEIEIRQDGNRLSGTARRISPLRETKRKWVFEGYVSGSRMIGFFYLTDQKIDPASYVTVIMARDSHARHEAVWRGFYTRPEFLSPDAIAHGESNTGIMWWQRSHPADSKHHMPLLEASAAAILPPSSLSKKTPAP